jgi:hypothetical protein
MRQVICLEKLAEKRQDRVKILARYWHYTGKILARYWHTIEIVKTASQHYSKAKAA